MIRLLMGAPGTAGGCTRHVPSGGGVYGFWAISHHRRGHKTGHVATHAGCPPAGQPQPQSWRKATSAPQGVAPPTCWRGWEAAQRSPSRQSTPVHTVPSRGDGPRGYNPHATARVGSFAALRRSLNSRRAASAIADHTARARITRSSVMWDAALQAVIAVVLDNAHRRILAAGISTRKMWAPN